jgi:hypothetical protein
MRLSEFGRSAELIAGSTFLAARDRLNPDRAPRVD